MLNIKKQLKTLPKFVSLVILLAGFIYAGRELANNDMILTIGVVLLGVFLVEKAK